MSHTILITNKKSLMSVLRDIKKKKIHAPNIFEMLNNMLIHQGVSYSSYHADLWYLRNIPEYYDVNMSFFKSRELFDKIFKDTSLVSGIIPNEITFIGMYGDVKNSFIAEGCFVNGVLENSICFPGAIIAEKSVVRDSIILPFAAIGKKTNLTRVILDEFTDYSNSDRLYNIGDSCRIGTSMDNLKNNDFPKSLFNGITLVGKNCRIPDSVTVGGGCFISSATDSSSFTRVKTIDDGLSIIQTEGIL